MSKKEKKDLMKIKDKVIILRKNGQLPYSLYLAVIGLNYDSDKQYVKYLKNLCDKYLRVGGYYIRHPEMAYECDKELNIK